MVEVRVMLRDAQERTWFGQFMDVIDQYRADPQSVPQETPPAPEQAIVTPAGIPAGIPAEVIADISPEAVTVHTGPRPVIPDAPTDAQMFSALREVLRKEGGYAAAQAVLARHGVTKITDEMTADVRAALYAELTK
jgi:hypothetical protein